MIFCKQNVFFLAIRTQGPCNIVFFQGHFFHLTERRAVASWAFTSRSCDETKLWFRWCPVNQLLKHSCRHAFNSPRRSGAKHLNLWTEEGLQQMTFGMDLKNLWSKNNRKASGWWFQIFVIFIPTWGNDPIWLIFFKWVETTNQASIGVRGVFFLRGVNIWLDICKGCVYKPCRMNTFYMYLSKVLRVIQIDPLHVGWTSKWCHQIVLTREVTLPQVFQDKSFTPHLQKPFVRWVNHRNRLSESWKINESMRRKLDLAVFTWDTCIGPYRLPYLNPPPFSWTDSQRLPFLHIIRLFQRKGSESDRIISEALFCFGGLPLTYSPETASKSGETEEDDEPLP